MFEKFNTPALYIAFQPVLSLYASGRNTGLVVESGDGVTYAVAIHGGRVVPNTVVYHEMAGRELTDYLMRILMESGVTFLSRDARQDVRDIKEKLCYVALDFEQEMKKVFAETEYELSNESIITFAKERIRCPESLFKPPFQSDASTGLHRITQNSIMKCDKELQKDLYNNIVLAGGSTMFPGFVERFENEVKVLAPPGTDITVIAPPERKFSTWIGGTAFALNSGFKEKCISKKEYDEFGASVVHRKCDNF